MTTARVRLTNEALIFGRMTDGSEAAVADQAALDTILYAQHKSNAVSGDSTSPEAFDALVENLQWSGWELLTRVETSAVPMDDPGDPTGDELKKAVERFFDDEVTRAVLGAGRITINAFFRDRSQALGEPTAARIGVPGGRPGQESSKGGGGVLCIQRSYTGGQLQARAATFRITPPHITTRCATLRLSLRMYATKMGEISAFLQQEIGNQVQNLDF